MSKQHLLCTRQVMTDTCAEIATVNTVIGHTHRIEKRVYALTKRLLLTFMNKGPSIYTVTNSGLAKIYAPRCLATVVSGRQCCKVTSTFENSEKRTGFRHNELVQPVLVLVRRGTVAAAYMCVSLLPTKYIAWSLCAVTFCSRSTSSYPSRMPGKTSCVEN